MGAFQLPDSVLGDAIGCLIYSFLCLIANSLLVWLIWTHNERKTCTSTPRPRKKQQAGIVLSGSLIITIN